MKRKITVLLFIISFGLQAQLVRDTLVFNKPDTVIFIDTANPSNIWQIGMPSKAIFDSAFAGNRAMVTDTINVYPINNKSSFTLGFELFGGGPSITFKHRFNTDSLFDGGYVEASADSGKTWLLLIDTTGQMSAGNTTFFGTSNPYGISTSGFYSTADSLTNSNVGFSGNSSGWKTSSILFPCFAIKKPFEYYLRFTFVSDSVQNSKDGWMIDEIIVDNSGACSNLTEQNILKAVIFPNPSNTYATITLPNGKYVHNGVLSIYNTIGGLIFKTPFIGDKLKFNLSDLPKGMHQILISENEQVIAQAKLFVQ